MTGAPGGQGAVALKGKSQFGDLRVRILSGIAVAAIALTCIWLGGWFSTILILAAGTVMLLELGRMTVATDGIRLEVIALIAGMAAGAILTELAYLPWGIFAISAGTIVAAAWSVRRLGRRTPNAAMTAFIGVAAVGAIIFALDGLLPREANIALIACAAVFWAAIGSGEDRLRSTVMLVGGVYISAAVIAFVALRGIETCNGEPCASGPIGLLSILWAALVVIAADVGGYFAGRVIGGPKLWPRVSPKKTWAGLGGGVVLAFIVGGLFSWATTGTYFYQVCTVSMIAALLSQGGDLAESAVKRRFGVKDSGSILPGHGGLLDRLDGHMAAILVAAVVTFSRGQPVFVW